MRILKIVAGIGLILLLVPVLVQAWYTFVANPRVARELMDDPDGERARRVMMLALPSGRELPVNYLLEGDMLYAAADGRWWNELEGDGVPVEALVRGVRLEGMGRAVLDEPEYQKDVFSRLRPNAVEGFGTLVEIALPPDAER